MTDPNLDMRSLPLTPSRIRPALLGLALASTFALPGCYGPSNDKGDNGGSLITPKPSKIEDGNTAGDRKSVLPPVADPAAKPDNSTGQSPN